MVNRGRSGESTWMVFPYNSSCTDVSGICGILISHPVMSCRMAVERVVGLVGGSSSQFCSL